jgi:hypothetical protein
MGNLADPWRLKTDFGLAAAESGDQTSQIED